MKNENQQIIKFDYDKNFKDEDFFISKSNEHIYNFLINGQNGRRIFKYNWREIFR